MFIEGVHVGHKHPSIFNIFKIKVRTEHTSCSKYILDIFLRMLCKIFHESPLNFPDSTILIDYWRAVNVRWGV
jgi:hypothetical protein